MGVMIRSNRPLRCSPVGILTQNHKLPMIASPIRESVSISKVLLGQRMKPFRELLACKSPIDPHIHLSKEFEIEFCICFLDHWVLEFLSSNLLGVG